MPRLSDIMLKLFTKKLHFSYKILSYGVAVMPKGHGDSIDAIKTRLSDASDRVSPQICNTAQVLSHAFFEIGPKMFQNHLYILCTTCA